MASQPDFKAKLTLEAEVSPSEDPAKVLAAMKSLIGGEAEDESAAAHSARIVTTKASALVRIRDQLRDRHVRSAARRQLLLGTSKGSATLMFNRQAAAAGVMAVCASPEESTLGPIYMKLESGRLSAAVEWLTAYLEG